VYRELHRHRIGISINEESGRYKEMRPKFYIPARERNLIQTGKAGHYIFSPGDDAQYRTLSNVLKGSFTDAWTDYRDLLKHGIAKEVARMCLPVSIFSSQYYTVNARSLMAILSLRKELTEEEAKFPSHPMKEINILVDKMEESFSTLMPITWASFVKNGYVSP
jgi:thymidylate synthase (FAD)